jgi:predicted dehydrogenase
VSARLVAPAAKVKRTLMVDHTFVYTGAVRKMRELVESGQVGDLLYYDGVRVNLGLFQHDVNVVWDLAPHDASIVENLVKEQPIAVQAIGVKHVDGQHENIAYVTMLYQSKLIVHFHLNWLSPVKIRTTVLGGSKKMIVWDDMLSSDKVKVYDRGVEVEQSPEKVYQLRVGYRSGDMFSPKIDVTEALRVEAAHFQDCIANGKTPITDGLAGKRVVGVLEAAAKSMAQDGKLIKLTS